MDFYFLDKYNAEVSTMVGRDSKPVVSCWVFTMGAKYLLARFTPATLQPESSQ